MLLVQTVLWVGTIAVLATCLGFPLAWALRGVGVRRWMLGLAVAPLLLPSYLAFSGWGILRDPMGPWGIGNVLGRLPPGVLVWTGKGLAVWALALWASPLAALCMLGSARRVSEEVIEGLRLDEPGGRQGERPGVNVPDGRTGKSGTHRAGLGRLRVWGMKWCVVLGMMRGGIVASLAVVGVVMLGSAVPLHLAQVETYAIEIWRQLSLTTRPAEVWVRAWPLLLVALGAGWAIARGMGASGDGNEEGNRQVRPAARRQTGGSGRVWGGGGGSVPGAPPSFPLRRPAGRGSGRNRSLGTRGAWISAVVVWGLAVMVPMVLFVSALRAPGKPWSVGGVGHVLRTFWRGSWSAAVSSLWVSLAAAGCALVIGMAVFAAAGVRGAATLGGRGRQGGGHRLWRGVLLIVIGGLALTAIVPGVLVGSALLEGWTRLGLLGEPDGAWSRACEWVVSSGAIVVMGNVLRFGFLAAAIGWWAAWLEGRAVAEQRMLDGGDRVRGWAAVNLFGRGGSAGGLGAVVGAAIATGVLAFHEIEATVILQPPGVESFSRQLLENLHFARDDRTAAAAVSLVGIGVLLAWAAGAMVGAVVGRFGGEGGEAGRGRARATGGWGSL